MSTRFLAGGGQHYVSREVLASEFRAQALQMQVEHLSRDLTRLRASVRDHITALSSDKPRTLARLRFLLDQSHDASA